MSDTRLRQLARDLDAAPSAAALARLDAERARVGDGPWLPALVYADPFAEARNFANIVERIGKAVGVRVSLADLVAAWASTPTPRPRGVTAYHAAMRDIERLDALMGGRWSGRP